MKKTLLVILGSMMLTSSFAQTTAQPDSLGLPGDNLNLYAVLDLFTKSETFESFEQQLNAEDTKINNLDLDNDGKIDYLRVIDNKDGDNHAIVIQDAISKTENQDVAVIELEKTSNGQYNVQIIGNEELYGKDYIIEPADISTQTKTANPAYNNTNNAVPQTSTTTVTNVYVEPAQWPIVVYMYRPAYVVYVSPWYWGYYPPRWQPWRPVYYRTYYGYNHRHYPFYHQHYRRTVVYRSPVVHSYYGPRRSTSVIVTQNRSQGVYHHTYTPATRQGGNPNRSRQSRGYNPQQRKSTSQQPANRSNQGPRMRSGGNGGSNTNTSPRMRSNNQPQNNTPRTNRAGGGNQRGGNNGGGGGNGGGQPRRR